MTAVPGVLQFNVACQISNQDHTIVASHGTSRFLVVQFVVDETAELPRLWYAKDFRKIHLNVSCDAAFLDALFLNCTGFGWRRHFDGFTPRVGQNRLYQSRLKLDREVPNHRLG